MKPVASGGLRGQAWSGRILFAVITLLAGFIASYLTERYHMFGAAVAGVTVSFLVRRRVAPTLIGSSIVFALVLFVMFFAGRAFEGPGIRRYAILDPEVFCQPLLAACVTILCFRMGRRSGILLLSCAYVSVIVASIVLVPPMKRDVALGVIIAMCILMLVCARLDMARGMYWLDTGRSRVMFRLSILAAAVIAALLLFFPVRNGVFASYYRFVTHGGYRVSSAVSDLWFGSTVNLREALPNDSAGRNRVVLRVESDEMPGYMRGFVYERYVDGQWAEVMGGTQLVSSEEVGNNVWRFRLPSRNLSATGGTEVSVQLSSRFGSPVLLLPGNVLLLDLASRSLVVDRNGVVFPSFETRSDELTYSGIRMSPGSFDAYELPERGDIEDMAYLEIPSAIRSQLGGIVEDALSVSRQETDREIVESVTEYFRNGFKYRLGIQYSAASDPLIDFLTETRAGHCTMFATAAVMLLRANGVPSRMVTGFVCSERHPTGKYWVARENCAHAWAEALLKEENRWIMVECTPSSGIPSGESDFGRLSSLADMAAFYWRKFLSVAASGRLGDLVWAGGVAIATGGYRFFSDFVRAVCAVLIIILLILWRWFRQRFRRLASEGPMAPLHSAFRLIVLEAARHGLEYGNTETVREFMNRANEELPTGRALVMTELLSEYERIRYGSIQLSRGDAVEFRDKVRVRMGFRMRNPIQRISCFLCS